ncbi:MAG TPA: PAS domain S-box protein [Lacunisphaera sp.]|nr:PAS domain S-box protein [Lacunisphaera sp.]
MKILHLEDNLRDAELVRELLHQDWPVCDITLVATREEFIRALDEGGYDLILSDFQLPGFGGLEALEIVRQRAPHLPFIFFSGTIGEERAIEAVRAGAADYVIKDRMQRLPVSIQRIVREAEEQRERRRIEDALAEQQYYLLMLMENLPDHVYFKDLESRFISSSKSFLQRHGLTPVELRGKTDFDLFDAAHAQRARADELEIIRTGRGKLEYEEREIRRDGSVAWVLTSKLPMRDAAGKVIGTFGISRDITARKLDEERIREQAEIIDQAPITILLTDLAHRITYCNMGTAQLLGRPREELLGATAEEVLSPETMEQLKPARDATLTRGTWTGEMKIATRDARQAQVELHMSVIRDPAGRPKGRLTIAMDITEKKKLEEQFLRAQRLESLGMLSAGIAHDLNNVLAPVLMGAPLLRLRSSNPADVRVLETIENSANRGAALVKQILSFAHGASGEKTLIQAKHLLRDIALLVEETFPRNIQLEDHVPNDLWTFRGNPTQIHQVLLNLCVNARDAMPGGGRLTLRAENRVLDAAALREVPAGSPGAYVALTVADTGGGIAPEVMPHIWEPFFTTKGEGRGTGLGLATVRGIATNHGGFVSVYSEPGRGTRFTLFLPAVEQTLAASDSAAANPQRARGRGELVLVVDDEVSVRELITAILSRFGYRVLTATNGLEAMAIYPPRVAEIALVITDLSMPLMGGRDMALALSQLNPNVRVLYISGAEERDKIVGSPLRSAVLSKPFTADRLLSAVREVLTAT